MSRDENPHHFHPEIFQHAPQPDPFMFTNEENVLEELAVFESLEQKQGGEDPLPSFVFESPSKEKGLHKEANSPGASPINPQEQQQPNPAAG